jgi:hypothetical protein
MSNPFQPKKPILYTPVPKPKPKPKYDPNLQTRNPNAPKSPFAPNYTPDPNPPRSGGGSSRSSSSSSSNAAALQAEARRKAEEAEKKRQAAEAQQRAKEAAEAKAAAEKAAKEQQRQQRIQQNVQAYLDRTSKTFVDVGERRGVDPRLLASQSTGGRPIGNKGEYNGLSISNRNTDRTSTLRTYSYNSNAFTPVGNNNYLQKSNKAIEKLLEKSQNVVYKVDTRGEYRATPKTGRTFQNTIFKLESTAAFSDSTIKKKAAGYASGALSGAGGYVDLFKALASPVDTTKGLYVLATDPIQRDLTIKQIKDVSIGPAATPERTAGFLTVEAATTFLGPPLLKKFLSTSLDVVTATGAKQVPVSKVSKTGQYSVPTAKTVDESLNRFLSTGKPEVPIKSYVRQSKPQTIFVKGDELASNEFIITYPQSVSGGKRKAFKEVVTASPQPIKGLEAGVGKKASGGLEDPGIYVAPKGDASLKFLRITDDLKEYFKGNFKFSLNPLDFLKVTRPTITEFRVPNVVRYPRDVVKTPGFDEVARYGKDVLSPTGVAVITKRSEIGMGALSKQKFAVPKGTLNPWTGQIYKKKTSILEAGTKEAEGVLPLGTRFFYFQPKKGLAKLKGYKEFFSFKGRNVPILKGKTVSSADVSEIKRLQRAGAKEISYDNFVKQKSISDEFLYSTPSSKTRSLPITSQYKVPSSVLSSNMSRQFSQTSSALKPSSFEGSYIKSTVSKGDTALSNMTSSTSKAASGTSSLLAASSTSSMSGLSSFLSGGSSISRIPPPPAIITPVPAYPKPPVVKREKGEKKAKGYDVFIKEKGKFFKANKQPKNYGAAFNLGASAVDNSAAATFKIKPTTKPAKITESLNSFLMMKYRQPKGKSKNKITDTFIEKTKHRIDSQGEIKGISAKGWIANRRKKNINFSYKL